MASGKALSVDLRTRAVEAYENGEGTLQEIADRFCISRTTLCNLVRLQRYTGSLEPSTVRGHKPKSVDEAGRERIRALVAEQPDALLEELTDRYNAAAETPISRATLGREVQRMGLTRKKRPSGRSSGTRRLSKRGASGSLPGSKA
jgi:transposase